MNVTKLQACAAELRFIAAACDLAAAYDLPSADATVAQARAVLDSIHGKGWSSRNPATVRAVVLGLFDQMRSAELRQHFDDGVTAERQRQQAQHARATT